jgi:hypothetical protein
LADKAGVSKNTVYGYLDGRTQCLKDESRRDIAGALGLKEEDLPG